MRNMQYGGRAALVVTLLALAGCSGSPVTRDGGPDAGPMPDGGGDAGPMPVDGGPMPVDGGPMPVDGGPMPMDGGPMPMDGGPMPMDGGPMPMDGGPMIMDAGPMMVGGGAATSMQIRTARETADGIVALPIDDAIVTYLKPAVGTDMAGFFVQAERMGPALFVAVDPVTLTPSPAVGDVVSFRIDALGTVDGRREATVISSLVVESSGNDIGFLVQEVSAATDLVTALDSYESELITLTGTAAAAFAFAGTGHVASPIDTAGIVGDANLRLRVPATVRDALDLAATCEVTITGVMWRFNAVAQPSIYDAADIAVGNCPAPTVIDAAAASPTEVTVAFDRNIDPTSVMTNGSQFGIVDAGGMALTVSAASVSGRSVTLTTTMQMSGATYTVTVASSVLDLAGAGVDTTANTATFTGYVSCADDHIVINEIDYDQTGADTVEFVEIYNPTSAEVSLANLALVLFNGGAAGAPEYRRVALSGTLAAGQYGVITVAAVTVPDTARRFPFGGATDQIQNGAPDVVALLDTSTGTIVDVVVYEGTVTAVTPTGGTAISLGAQGASAGEDPTSGSLARFPNGCDRDMPGTDWAATSTVTPGAANAM